MEFGITFKGDIDPKRTVALCKQAEQAGFTYAWFFDSHVLWRELGHATALIDEPWPAVDATALQTSSIEMVVQVNGKLRAHVTVAVGADENTVRAAALADPHVQKFVAAAPVRRVIIVPGKLVNIVV